MEDSQRQAMYDGWARGKKWVDVELKLLEGGTWMATPKSDLGMVIYRDSKILAIQAIQGKLAEKGYEISNLSELIEVDTVSKERVKTDADKINELIEHLKPKCEKRRTFIEWCKYLSINKNLRNAAEEYKKKVLEAENWYIHRDDIPQHKLKDPSKFGAKLCPSNIEASSYREYLELVEKISNVKINMPEGKIEYKP